MQRFLRDPGHSLSADHFSQACDERVAVVQRHFPPSVAAVYAIPRLGDDGVLEWWTNQQGLVRPFATMSEGEQQAMLDSYARHQAQLGNLAEALQEKGLAQAAELVRALQFRADPKSLFSVEGRLLVTRWVHIPRSPAAAPVASPVADRPRRWLWLAVPALLVFLLLLLLGLLYWFIWRAAPEPAAAPGPSEPPPAQAWPAELVFLLDTSAFMAQSPAEGSLPRSRFAASEMEKIIKALPDRTHTRLVHYPGGQCGVPVQYGPYEAAQRDELLARIRLSESGGNAPLAAGLRAAADAVDGKERDALIVVFAGAVDTCGQDTCAQARKISQQKPKLKINLVDLSGKHAIDTCVAELTGGNSYVWSRGDGNVDLSDEVAKMLD